MTKIVYNACYGGFDLSEEAVQRYAELKGIALYPEQLQSGSRVTTYWTVPFSERRDILSSDAWHAATLEQRRASNDARSQMTLCPREHEFDIDLPHGCERKWRNVFDIIATAQECAQ